METTFPFSSFERQQHFAPAVKVTKPFFVFRVGKMRPGVFVHFFKPAQAFFISGERVSFYQADERFDMHQPQFLVPLQLLGRISLNVEKIENSHQTSHL